METKYFKYNLYIFNNQVFFDIFVFFYYNIYTLTKYIKSKFMFGNKDKSFENIKDAQTVIGPAIKVKGNFHGRGNIIIEGSLEGSIKTDSSLLIGEKAKVKANIKAKEAIINGSVEGNVNIEKTLSLGKTASVKGDVVCAQISINQGAKINGNFTMDNENSSSEKEVKENKGAGANDKNNNK